MLFACKICPYYFRIVRLEGLLSEKMKEIDDA
jgi:hypothetical protein